MDNKPLVELNKINKSFPGVKALTDVSIEFYPGKVHVLLGENGAGKSTIIKIISGVYIADSGLLTFKGNKERFTNTRESLAKGISVIHQELSVIEDLTVAENIFLGREPKTVGGFLNKKKMNSETKDIFTKMNINIDPSTYIRNLNNADKQMVEIAKAVSQNSEVVIMDEPTSSLSDKEVETLFEVIERLKKQNVAIIYISHRLKEIMQIGDIVTILRDGNVVKTTEIKGISQNDMISLMVGREITKLYIKSDDTTNKEVVLKVNGFTKKGFFEDVSFELYKGEVLGISGLIGAGRTEVMRAIFGADKIDKGEMWLFDKKGVPTSTKHAIGLGLGLIPEDRRHQALLLEKSVRENTTLASVKSNSYKGFINFKWEKESTDLYIKKMRTKTPSQNTIIKNLSGGNQQKVIISRWLLSNSKILIMDEPTRGIDVNAKAEIYKLMKEFVENGGSIIMVSSDLPEVIGVSNRILVMREGKVSGILNSSEADEMTVMKLASIKDNSI